MSIDVNSINLVLGTNSTNAGDNLIDSTKDIVAENIGNSLLQHLFPLKTVDEVLSDKTSALILSFFVSIYNRLYNSNLSDDPKIYSIEEFKEFLSMSYSDLGTLESPFLENLFGPIKKIVLGSNNEYSEEDIKKAYLLYNGYYDGIDSLRNRFKLTPKDVHLISKEADKIPFLNGFHRFASIINAEGLSSQLGCG